ncbi:NAD-dependent protein deacetylase [Sciscionella sediminilitoris]|uniref:NAD-dependent protein deacetylase n=1 Tax=Sciscionella sediminilitoris TaxID=1445613 RepID=UPI0004DEDBF6|nr:NAD-dependent protein deacetylase [Sciscionella sp. SE31]
MRTRPTLSWTGETGGCPVTGDLDAIEEALRTGGVLALSGAGISTESGIPDYRGETGSLRRHTPMTYEEFLHSVSGRRRYWARSHLGWRTIARARPNAGHHAVAGLRAAGRIGGVITQNVDGLHTSAGTPDVVELHGNLDRVICLGCSRYSEREALDRRLRAANPDFTATASEVNPDGDVELAEEIVREFTVVDCESCGGVLKPDVVFFGESVPRPRVAHCFGLVDRASAVLVLGSSLAVMSGLRFVRHAAKSGKPVLIVNNGVTRGDEHAVLRVQRPLGTALTELGARLAHP